MTYRRTIYIDTEVEVSVDDIIDELTEDEIKELYEDAFGKPNTEWATIYEKRRSMTDEQFLHYIDQTIMDITGRVL